MWATYKQTLTHAHAHNHQIQQLKFAACRTVTNNLCCHIVLWDMETIYSLNIKHRSQWTHANYLCFSSEFTKWFNDWILANETKSTTHEKQLGWLNGKLFFWKKLILRSTYTHAHLAAIVNGSQYHTIAFCFLMISMVVFAFVWFSRTSFCMYLFSAFCILVILS